MISWLCYSKSGMNLSRGTRQLGVREGKLAVVELRPLLEEGYTHLVISLPTHKHEVTHC